MQLPYSDRSVCPCVYGPNPSIWLERNGQVPIHPKLTPTVRLDIIYRRHVGFTSMMMMMMFSILCYETDTAFRMSSLTDLFICMDFLELQGAEVRIAI